jgi:hypothetical protein
LTVKGLHENAPHIIIMLSLFIIQIIINHSFKDTTPLSVNKHLSETKNQSHYQLLEDNDYYVLISGSDSPFKIMESIKDVIIIIIIAREDLSYQTLKISTPCVLMGYQTRKI